MGIRTEQLFVVPAPGAGVTLAYTSPAGTRTRVRRLSALHTAGAAGELDLVYRTGPGGLWQVIGRVSDATVFASHHQLDLWHVINPGEQLGVSAIGTWASAFVSGRIYDP